MKQVQLPVCVFSALLAFVAYGHFRSTNAQTPEFQTRQAKAPQEAAVSLNPQTIRWRVSRPFLAVDTDQLPKSPGAPWISVKDPSVVFFDDRWHLFCTLRKRKTGDGRIRIGYVSYSDWKDAQSARWHVLDLTPDYHGAPQIFFFEPDQKWYLIYQASDPSRGLPYGPCFSTNPDLDSPENWTLPEPLYKVKEGSKAGLDYWVICDDMRAYLFFTTLDGKMWRSETRLSNFPDQAWSTPTVALQADIFEASHTYRIKNVQKYLTIVESQSGRRRYFKAFIASQLDGPWKPLNADSDPFVGPSNVVNQSTSWAHSYSHGELIRSGHNQNLEIDGNQLKLVFQGASDVQYRRGNYGEIPWRLGILSQEPETTDEKIP